MLRAWHGVGLRTRASAVAVAESDSQRALAPCDYRERRGGGLAAVWTLFPFSHRIRCGWFDDRVSRSRSACTALASASLSRPSYLSGPKWASFTIDPESETSD